MDWSAFSTSARARPGFASHRESQRAFAVEEGDVRVQLDRHVEVGHRPVEVAQVMATRGAMIMGPRLARDAADELIELGAASAPFAELVEGRAAVEVGVRQSGVEPQRLVAVGDRAAKISDLQPGEGPRLVRRGVIGGEADGRVEFGQRTVPVLGLGVLPAAAESGSEGRGEPVAERRVGARSVGRAGSRRDRR